MIMMWLFGSEHSARSTASTDSGTWNVSQSVALSGTQWHSVALSGTQWHSVGTWYFSPSRAS